MVLAVTDFLEPTKTPVLSVTHDIGEAFLLAAEVIRIADGRVIEQGPVATVLSAERERLAHATQRLKSPLRAGRPLRGV